MRALALLPIILLAAACADEAVAPEAETPAGTATPAPSDDLPGVVFVTSEGARAPLRVEIADTPEERAVGLMNRESLAADAGMLFIWPEPSNSGFWMKNTLIPLSVAFIREDGTIVHIEDMAPLDETLHRSPETFRYGIEVNQGWFEENGVEVGDRVVLPEGFG